MDTLRYKLLTRSPRVALNKDAMQNCTMITLDKDTKRFLNRLAFADLDDLMLYARSTLDALLRTKEFSLMDASVCLEETGVDTWDLLMVRLSTYKAVQLPIVRQGGVYQFRF